MKPLYNVNDEIIVQECEAEDMATFINYNRIMFPFVPDNINSIYNSSHLINLIFTFNDEIIGISSVTIKSKNTLYFYTFGIVLQYRGMGYGKMILKQIESYFQSFYKISIFTLHCKYNNEMIKTFYEKNYYVLDRIEQNYYPCDYNNNACYYVKTCKTLE